MELSEIRPQIDAVNREMLRLFEKRMALCAQVAACKKAQGMEIFVPEREAAILDGVREMAAEGMERFDLAFFEKLMELSREYRRELLGLPENQ